MKLPARDRSYLQDLRAPVQAQPNGPVQALAADSEGRIWAGTPDGLYIGYREDDGLRFSPVPGITKPVSALLSSPVGLWAVAGTDLILLHPTSGHRVSLSLPLPGVPLQLIWGEARPWLVYPERLMVVTGGELCPIRIPDGAALRRIGFDGGGRMAAATDNGLWLRSGDEWSRVRCSETRLMGLRGTSPFSPPEIINDLTADSHGVWWTATPSGVILWAGEEFRDALLPSDGLPMREVRSLLLAPDGARWFVHPVGVSRLRDGEWRYFAGPRWLPSDDVDRIVPDGRGGIYAATTVGVGWIASESMTLEQKAERFEARLRERHERHGYVSTSILETAGDVATSIHEASDNDGLWTSLYVAAQCFRYRVTRDPGAKRRALESMAALERLERVTGIPGFPARAVALDGERVRKSDAENGEWHPFSVSSSEFLVSSLPSEAATGNWVEGEWKGDTSSDELVGHFFACAVVHDCIEDGEEKAWAAAYAGRIADHLIRNDFNLIDLDGKHTRWGFYSPKILNSPEGAAQRGLNSLEVLQHLIVAHTLTGKPRFRDAYLYLVHDHHYALNTLRQKVTAPGHVNHSDDELAFLSYYPLLRYETDPDLLAIYRKSFCRSWEIERPERSPFMNFLYGAAMGAGTLCDTDASRKALEEIPMDVVHWSMRNGHRDDLPREAEDGRFEEAQSAVALSPAERGMLKWNGNPYALDGGGGGASEEDGAFFLLPYWMGRAFGYL